MNNLLIVESSNDKYFIEAFITHLNIKVNLGDTMCAIDEYECLNGVGELEKRLTKLQAKIKKEDIQKVGIIFDADNAGIEERTKQIKEKLDTVFGTATDIDFTIYIMNIDGKGELETVLRHIKSKDSSIANCLDSWQACLDDDKKLNQKEFDKFWIQMYQRYDCCDKEEKKQAGIKCSNEASFSKSIYNLDNPVLTDLKTFLQKLGEQQ